MHQVACLIGRSSPRAPNLAKHRRSQLSLTGSFVGPVSCDAAPRPGCPRAMGQRATEIFMLRFKHSVPPSVCLRETFPLVSFSSLFFSRLGLFALLEIFVLFSFVSFHSSITSRPSPSRYPSYTTIFPAKRVLSRLPSAPVSSLIPRTLFQNEVFGRVSSLRGSSCLGQGHQQRLPGQAGED
jgi:hypothetical protein